MCISQCCLVFGDPTAWLVTLSLLSVPLAGRLAARDFFQTSNRIVNNQLWSGVLHCKHGSRAPSDAQAIFSTGKGSQQFMQGTVEPLTLAISLGVV